MKIFRKFRQFSLTNNRFGRYLVYALGEIVLVVIGILIALQLNNRNAVIKSNEKIETQVVLLKEELESNLKRCEGVLKKYHARDSLIQLVKDNRLTKADYENNPKLLVLINFYSTFQIQDYYTKSIISNADNIPEKYQAMLKELTHLNAYESAYIVKYLNVMASFNERMHERWAEKYTWFSEPRDVSHVEERIDFFLNDPAYINDVRLYSMYSKDNLVIYLEQFKERSERILDNLNEMNEN